MYPFPYLSGPFSSLRNGPEAPSPVYYTMNILFLPTPFYFQSPPYVHVYFSVVASMLFSLQALTWMLTHTPRLGLSVPVGFFDCVYLNPYLQCRSSLRVPVPYTRHTIDSTSVLLTWVPQTEPTGTVIFIPAPFLLASVLLGFVYSWKPRSTQFLKPETWASFFHHEYFCTHSSDF